MGDKGNIVNNAAEKCVELETVERLSLVGVVTFY